MYNGKGQRVLHDLSRIRETVKTMFFLEYFLNRWTPPAPLGTFRNKNVTFAPKKLGFQGQKQWPPKFHIKFRNPGNPYPLI